ncbi:MAG: hypothetical protein JWO08_3180 [Verrucomicrobiaceae bacterium]|nr:hypothetical protein [Verrucomicrobiaceae bacterium]
MNPYLPQTLLLQVIGSLLLLMSNAGAVEIHPGTGDFEFTKKQGNRHKPIKVWYYSPAAVEAHTPIVFVMHGVGRNGEGYRDAWVEAAKKRNFLLICPEFTDKDYPTSAYQLGNVLDRSGRVVAKEKWTYSTVEDLFDLVKKLIGSKESHYRIYGHSAGAQFVHRLVLLLPEARYSRAIAANPGWYTMPAFSIPFPYGLANVGVRSDDLSKPLGRDFVLLLGEADTNEADENLRKTPEAEAQGKTRFERGQRFYEAAQKAAADLKVPFAWKLKTVPGVGHSNPQMAPAAAAVFFDTK